MPTAPGTQPADSDPVDPAAGTGPAVRLTELSVGDRGKLHATRLAGGDREILRALGLAERSRFRVCKGGDPWILLVRSTRVGISDAVARRILVIPDRHSER